MKKKISTEKQRWRKKKKKNSLNEENKGERKRIKDKTEPTEPYLQGREWE